MITSTVLDWASYLNPPMTNILFTLISRVERAESMAKKKSVTKQAKKKKTVKKKPAAEKEISQALAAAVAVNSTALFLQVLRELIKLLQEIRPGHSIRPSWTLKGRLADRPPGLGFDGPGFSVLRKRVNERFGVALKDSAVKKAKTVEDLADAIVASLTS